MIGIAAFPGALTQALFWSGATRSLRARTARTCGRHSRRVRQRLRLVCRSISSGSRAISGAGRDGRRIRSTKGAFSLRFRLLFDK